MKSPALGSARPSALALVTITHRGFGFIGQEY